MVAVAVEVHPAIPVPVAIGQAPRGSHREGGEETGKVNKAI